MHLVEGALSARRVERQAPWLAGLHRLSTGALAGLGLAMVGLSGLTLYWQNEWARNFKELEAARVLEHRLQESASILEQHHLSVVQQPARLVPTSSQNLIHLREPVGAQPARQRSPLATLPLHQIPAGY